MKLNKFSLEITIPKFIKPKNKSSENEKDMAIDLPYDNEFTDLAGKIEEIIDKKSVEELKKERKLSQGECDKFFDVLILTKKRLQEKNYKLIKRAEMLIMAKNFPKYLRDLVLDNFEKCWKQKISTSVLPITNTPNVGPNPNAPINKLFTAAPKTDLRHEIPSVGPIQNFKRFRDLFDLFFKKF